MIRCKIVSDSMLPLIPVGAEIFLRKINKDEKFKVFDILVFKQNERLICHLFWHQNQFFDKDMIITRNLKAQEYDHPFERRMILGVVTNYRMSLFLKLKFLIIDKWRIGFERI